MGIRVRLILFMKLYLNTFNPLNKFRPVFSENSPLLVCYCVIFAGDNIQENRRQ